MKLDLKNIPKEIKKISDSLKSGSFECYLVGGCVRDLIMKREPRDWDFTTNATPEQIQAIFPDSFYENTFGTVGVKTDSEKNELKVVEITPYRKESGYSDKRHPNSVIWSHKIEEDLERRDFTINSLALDIDKRQIIDLYKGQEDISSGLIRAVGDPDKRFNEDALRMLRAIRFSSELGYTIEHETANSIAKNANLMIHISKERIGEEFKKIIMSKNPAIGIALTEKLSILPYISTDLQKCVGVSQNKQAHKYDVFEHLIRSLQHAADKNFSLEIRLAALFHDIAKPQTKRETLGQTTFYNHEVVGAKVTRETLKSLAFSSEIVNKVEKLVRFHMFFADTEEISLSAVRRLVAKVGKEDIWDLMNLRMCDRIGTGRPKEEPYRFRKYQSMIEEVMRDPISVTQLKINGSDIMNKLHVKPSPKIGHILHALLNEVLDDPLKNNSDILMKRAGELISLDEIELKKLGDEGKEAKTEKETEELTKIRQKRGVK